MPRSMTAYARITEENSWGSITCELRSVNHRFLEVGFRMPDVLRESETVLRDMTRKKLTRGKIDCSVQIAFNHSDTGSSLDLEVAQSHIEIAQAIANKLSDAAPISAIDIMQLPGVIKDASIEASQVNKAGKKAFDLALDQMLEGREREGAKLAEMVEQRLAGIESQIAIVRENLPEILQQQRTRLHEKLNELKEQMDEQRLEQEMVIIANRADVDEELDRLEAHISEIRLALKSKESIGRRLDFLMQELNREANTLGSKSISSTTTQVSVELKVLIEQMREQIQNIE
ncbi:MAG: YicC family protein [Cellvibrionales bacterium]|nr:YicC family protein [Cellvibrionales bacterium]